MYIVDGKVLSEKEFKELQANPKVRLILVEGTFNTFRTLQLLKG